MCAKRASRIRRPCWSAAATRTATGSPTPSRARISTRFASSTCCRPGRNSKLPPTIRLRRESRFDGDDGMMRRGSYLLLAFGMAGTLATPSLAADPVEDFYRDKSVTIFVGYDAGGGYDQYARLLARHMTRQIPGR